MITPFARPEASRNFHSKRADRVDSSKSGIVAADVSRLTLKKTSGTEPPDVGCYGFLNQPWRADSGEFEKRGLGASSVVARSSRLCESRNQHTGETTADSRKHPGRSVYAASTHQNATSVEFPKARKIPTVKRHECRAPPAFLNQPCGRDARATNWVVSFICLVQAAGTVALREKGSGFPGSNSTWADRWQTNLQQPKRPPRNLPWRARSRLAKTPTWG